jgi:sugar lactone lactonase YvrE
MRNNAWVRIAGASTVWGLALDRTRQRLYVGSPSTHNVHQLDLSSDPPQVTDFATTTNGGPNGLTIDAAGNVYFSDFNGGHVYRVTPDGTKTRVTGTTIPQANGLAFRADGVLLVDSYQRGSVIGLTLADGMETGRMTVVSGGLGNPDGLALDAMGNIYVTDNSGGRLIRLSPTGSNPEVLMMGLRAPANIEFGAGDLNCNDVYVATGSGLQRFQDNPSAGADVPWHH